MALAALSLAARCGTLSAQEGPASPPAAPASIVVMPARFATWDDEAHLVSPRLDVGGMRDTTVTWWGLGKGATIGATAALGLTQAFCTDDNGCVGRTIGAILMGSLLGGALESGMDY
jgi:hypothetical protein